MVIYFTGKIAAVVGPLDYSVARCNAYVDKAYETGALNYTTVKGIVLKDVKYSCEFHDVAPVIGTKFPY
jgi:hypothetical protein